MTAVLRHQFGCFQAVRSQLDPVAVLFQHAANKFAHTDGVVRDHDDAFLLHAIDCVGGDGAASHRRGSWCEHARGAGAGLNRAALVGFASHHAVQIDQQNQAAVRSDRCTGEKLHAAQVFPKVLDHDFVFAQNFLDDQADLTASNSH